VTINDDTLTKVTLKINCDLVTNSDDTLAEMTHWK